MAFKPQWKRVNESNLPYASESDFPSLAVTTPDRCSLSPDAKFPPGSFVIDPFGVPVSYLPADGSWCGFTCLLVPELADLLLALVKILRHALKGNSRLITLCSCRGKDHSKGNPCCCNGLELLLLVAHATSPCESPASRDLALGKWLRAGKDLLSMTFKGLEMMDETEKYKSSHERCHMEI